ncbi:hypothetical protein PHJA_001242800 [Phtheirospermum japonicum]|uniref:Uncharacterized protein n=1 Tax=Phtheirospermum japonicum TaxID=374723 RepID=A0A830C1H5_9LAMI|nr:hypothetical protein PHJA_001242800 [Phtheirospermum japonicum]
MSDSVNEDREQSHRTYYATSYLDMCCLKYDCKYGAKMLTLRTKKTTGMEEPNAMAIEFLRARLLSERSLSKSARQRANELAKRVSELEEQLKFVSLQRKKAEKATADVLAILENHGISDVSEEFDSCSDHDESPHDVKARNGSSTVEVTSINTSPIKNEMDAYSSSEIESSPSTGRSLSWRSTKEFQHSLEKKKYMDSVRRRASFASNSLSTRKIGKSCRRIRHRETRSRDESQNDGSENAVYSVDASDGSNAELVALRESSRYENGKNPPTSTTVGLNSETQNTNGLHFNVHKRDEDMERALRHQAQLIGRYEEEEKAQRAWEEKFRKNNYGTQKVYDVYYSLASPRQVVMDYRIAFCRLVCQALGHDVSPWVTYCINNYDCYSVDNSVSTTDLALKRACPLGPQNDAESDSGDHGNHSDVTEEQYEMKSPELSAAAKSNSNGQEAKQELVNACSNTEPPPQTSKSTLPSLSDSADRRSLHDEKYINACESEFSFPMPKKKRDKDFSRKQHEASEHRSQQFLPTFQMTTHGSTNTSSNEEKTVSLSASNRISSPLELAVMPQEPSNNLGPVLEALQRAKSSLNQKLNNLPVPTNAERNKVESFQIPFGTPGFFRLPTDYQFETGIEAQPRFANSLPENILGGFQSKPFVKSRSDFSGHLFLTAPYRPCTQEIRLEISPERSLSQPRSNEGPSSASVRTNNRDPYTIPVRDSYPFLPNITLRLPLNE